MYPHKLDDLLISMVEKGASDLHLVVGSPPMIRHHGVLQPLVEEKVAPEDSQELLTSVLSQEQVDALNKDREIDLAYAMARGDGVLERPAGDDQEAARSRARHGSHRIW